MFFKDTVCRKQQFSDILSGWCAAWESVCNKSAFRIPLVVTSGAPGDGKTRVCWTLAERKNVVLGFKDDELEAALSEFACSSQQVRDSFVKRVRSAVGVTVTFNFQSTPKQEEEAGSLLATRMLYSHFCRNDNFYQFFRDLKALGLSYDEINAYDVIQADIEHHLREKRVIVLAVDEILMSRQEDAVLASIGSLLSYQEAQQYVHVIGTHLGPERISKLLSESGRTLQLIMMSPMDEHGVAKVIASLDEGTRGVLRKPSFVSLIRDCCGVPRCVEFLCKVAGTLKNMLPQFADDRSAALSRVAEEPEFFKKFVADSSCESAKQAIVFAFGAHAITEQGRYDREAIFRQGFLHVIDGNAALDFGIPVLFFYLWQRKLKDSALLAAVLEFLRNDMVGPLVAEGQRFEEQVGALFRILSVVREEMIKRKDLFLVPEKRTMLSLLRRGDFKFSCMSVLPHYAVGQASVDNRYERKEAKFRCGADFDEFESGLHFPELANHKGFDLLLVDKMAEGANKRFFTAVECKFSKKDEAGKLSSSTSPADLAKKVCNALSEYPCLVTALLENRFCFVFASFQAFSGKETVESMATLILAELKEEKFSFQKKGEITEDHLLGCLIILRREHLEALLTPSLRDRYHFFKEEVSKQK
jgi:hypothetical protein